MFYLLKG